MVLAVLAAVFLLIKSLPGNGLDPAEQALDPLPDRVLPGQLLSMNGSGQAGRVYASIQEGKALVLVEVLNGSAAQPQPVYIHLGTCKALGVAKFRLPDVINGRSASASAVSAPDLMNLGDLSVVVVNPDDESMATSCANLTELVQSQAV